MQINRETFLRNRELFYENREFQVQNCKIVDAISGRGISATARLDRKGRPGVTPNGFFMRLPVTGSVDVK